MCVKDSNTKARIEEESEEFTIKTMVRKGDGLSPILINNSALKESLQKIKEQRRGVKLGVDLNLVILHLLIMLLY